MKTKLVGLAVLLMLFFSLATASITQPAKAQTDGNIYINADGSLQPADASISRNGTTYTLTADVNQQIIVFASHVTVDGAGHKIHLPSYWGISVENAVGVTVKNVKTSGGEFGILLSSSNQCTIMGNQLEGNGFRIFQSSNNVFSSNTVQNAGGDGVYAETCSGNVWTNNTITGCANGFKLWYCTTCSLLGNQVVGCNYGISFASNCDNNTVADNSVEQSTNEGITLVDSSSNNFTQNNVEGNNWGVDLTHLGYDTYYNDPCSGNRFWQNNFVNNNLQVVNNGAAGNFWDNGSRGNYWSNYNGTDADGDGIDDTPYTVYAGATDRYPLIAPFSASATPQPTPTPTATPSSSPSPSHSPSPTDSPTASPSVPEFPTWIVLPILVAVALLVVILMLKFGACRRLA